MNKAVDLTLLNASLKLAEKAMAEVLRLYENPSKVQVNLKADGSPVTSADHIAHEIIKQGLTEIDSSIPIISEESPVPPWSERKNFSTFWMVDPIDGTYGFVNRNGDFTINIALISDHQPVMGVVAVPVSGKLYFAHSGAGAFVRSGKGIKKLGAALFSKKESGLQFICSPHQNLDSISHYFDKFHRPQLHYRSGTIKFLLLAEGKAHIYPCNKNINEWDTAAGHIILEEAGGLVLRADNDQPLRYNKTDMKNPHFIAYGDIQDF